MASAISLRGCTILKKDKPYILLERGGLSSEFATTTKNLEVTNLHISNLFVSYSVSTL